MQALFTAVFTALRDDTTLHLRETDKQFVDGRCPECKQDTVYCYKDNPSRLVCGDSCGYSEETRERYIDLFDNIATDYPPTADNQHATADAYLSLVCGFTLKKLTGLYSQGSLQIRNSHPAATARFALWDGAYFDRVIDTEAIRILGRDDDLSKAAKYRGKHWAPAKQVIKKEGVVYITAHILDAIALMHAGKTVIATLVENNTPYNLIKEYKTKNIAWRIAFVNDENDIGQKAAIKLRAYLQRNDQTDVEIVQTPKGVSWLDLNRTGRLDIRAFEAALQLGRVETAPTVALKYYWKYRQKNYPALVIDHDHRLYQVSSDDYNDAIGNAIKQASVGTLESALKDVDSKDALATDEGREIFTKHVKEKVICNCAPIFAYAQLDKITRELHYYFSVTSPDRHAPDMYYFPGQSIDSAKAFKKALLQNVPGARFLGSDDQLERLSARWFDDGLTLVESVTFIGYHKATGAYLYPDFGFYQGRYLKPNKSEYVTAGKHRLKTTLKSIEIQTHASLKTDWFKDYKTVFDLNGVIVLAYFLGSLFAEQIRERLGFFPFLEFTGEGGAGKSTVLEYGFKCIGRSGYEGFNPNNATVPGLAREFAQVSNMPVSLIESKSKDEKNARKGNFEFMTLKEYFNGRALRITGAFNRGNDTVAPLFKGSIIISQNESVDGDEALLTRIVHIHATREHQKRENKHLADWFRRIDIGEVSGFLYQALKKEKQIIDSIVEHYQRLDDLFALDDRIKHVRVVECHALVGGMVNAMAHVLSDMDNDTISEAELRLHDRAVDRQSRLNQDHPLVSTFWELFYRLNMVEEKSSAAAHAGLETVERASLNHSINDDLIAINLFDMHKAVDRDRQQPLDLTALRKLLPGSVRHPFVEFKNVKSAITKGKVVSCAVFKVDARA